jgi:hypothetical protein
MIECVSHGSLPQQWKSRLAGLSAAGFPAQERGGLAEQSCVQNTFAISAADAKPVGRLLRKNGGALVKALSDRAAIFSTGRLRPG